MRVYLMRHGIAISRDDPNAPPEADRNLTPAGIEKTRAASRGLRTLGIEPDAVFTSPYLRAVETAEIACESLGFPANKIRHTDALTPDAKPAALFKELEDTKFEEVLCCGHAPNLDHVIAFAVRAPSAFTELKKAGVACLEVDSLSPVRAKLLWLQTAKSLRLLGK